MAYASQSGRARTDAKSPQAHAICDRCGFRYNHADLMWQYDWRGPTVQNLRILVCRRCLDDHQEQLRAITLPADPVPVMNARPENFTIYEAGSTPNQPYGSPVGLEPGGVMPLNQGVAYGVPLAVISLTSAGGTTVSATCSAAHGLSTGSQIAVSGVTQAGASGFFSVVVTGAMSFTYATYAAIPAGPLLTPTSQIITALVGLPYGVTTIPQVGP